jgi:hypothetical protein
MQNRPISLETAFAFDVSYQLGDQRALEFDYPPAGAAYQMIVLCGTFDLVVAVNIIKAYLPNQSQLLKQAEITVHCGEADLAVSLDGLPV